MAKKVTSETTVEKKKPTKTVDLQKFLKEIEKRAYEIYQNRIKSNTPGDEFTDWIKAESDIKAKYKI